ncbi:hypothetical protein OHA72_42735 [Dactylosporangium sp. NBC_01737]|uniref:hypothetical protein n=1 Tax=Dactylosporangium sp. NBC_01737 TaxID=2975959 RepID=UPI002E0FF063|nr:hypothetical protein OHA72_42735 [Dactylosporangium sp. NBC_01737]
MIEELIRRVAEDDEDAAEELTGIAGGEPQRLTPYHGLMFDLDVLWPPTLYRGAGDDVVGRVVERVDDGRTPDQLNHLLLVLAHSGHPLAEDALRRWEEQPPQGSDKLHVGALRYASQGGWTVAPDGSRRELCGGTAYQWLMREAPRAAGNPDCPWCGSPLWTAADIDTAEPAVGAALAHTGWSGRLVFRACIFCACSTTVYSEVTPAGAATWWAGNTGPDHLPAGAGPEEPPTLLPGTGPERPSPYQGSAWSQGGSTLGGHPDWIQDAEHVECPGCRQLMDYAGMVVGSDLDEYGEGAYYLHVHAPCGFAAMNYQQS